MQKKFGFKIIHHKELESIDTVTLQYNWQLWETKAYSLMCPSTKNIDQATADHILHAMLRFMDQSKIINYNIYNAYASNVISKKDIKIVKTSKSGIFTTFKFPGEYVHRGDTIGTITNALTGEIEHKFKATQSGMIISVFKNALITENSIVYRIAK
ncbi:MAG: hypothetical protein IE878_05305 [Epsilonproteobacteria bacterium]|nr:hypothetical protein [Campylobacterota bacterium]